MSSNSWLRTHDHMSSSRATRIVGAARMLTDLNLDPLPIEFQGESFRERNKMFLSKMLLRTLMFCVVVGGLPTAVYAQSGVSENTVTALMFGRVNRDITPGVSVQVPFNSLPRAKTLYNQESNLSFDYIVDNGVALASGSVLASAKAGELRLYISGIAQAQGYRNQASVSVRASAAYYDTLSLLGVEQIIDGTELFVEASLKLSGAMTVSAAGILTEKYTPYDDYRTGGGQVSLFINGDVLGSSPYGGGLYGKESKFYINNNNNAHYVLVEHKPYPETIDIFFTIIAGTPYDLTLKLELTGNAVASDQYLAGAPGGASGSFIADVSRTLKWGGISNISRADTGETLTGWSIASASGFDYSKPAAVPEPSTVLLAATAALLLVRRRHKRS